MKSSLAEAVGPMLISIVTLAVSVSAEAEIYRCQHEDGVIEFTDRPCSAEAKPHQSSGSMSIVAPSADLNQVQQRNRVFIENREQALQQQREQAAELARQQRQQNQADALRQLLNERNRYDRSYPALFSPRLRPAIPDSSPDPPVDSPTRVTPAARRALLSRSRDESGG